MWSRNIRILLVTGQVATAHTFQAALTQHRDAGKRPVQFHINHASTSQAAMDLLQEMGYDAILLDLRPYSRDSLQDIALLRHQAAPFIPIITLLDDADEKNFAAIKNAGADECLTRSLFPLIPHALRFLASHRLSGQNGSRTGQYFQMLIPHYTDITALMDSNARVLYISPSVENILGYEPDRLHNLIALDFVHPDDLNHVRARLAEVLTHPSQRITSEIRLRHKNRSWIPLEIAGSAVPYEAGKLHIIVNARAKPATAAEPAPDRSTMPTILVLESDPDIRESASAVLRNRGFRVLAANTSLQALEFSNHHNPKTDLIITNLALCNSTNGHSVLEELKAGNPDLKVILISGNSTHPESPKNSTPANSRFLSQPFDTHTLCETVHQTLQI